ncbi:MAG TPA: VWA domain-containing protein [Bacillota bacterium]|nr:VWA domain-containing protein [Bacillota bacterium]
MSKQLYYRLSKGWWDTVSSHNTFLDGLFRSYVNGMLPQIKRAKPEEMEQAYSQIWLGKIEDPLRQNGKERAKSLLAIMQGITRIITIIYGSNHCRINFLGEGEEVEDILTSSTITISWEPILLRPKGHSFFDAVDVMTGAAIHQAAHLREKWDKHPFNEEDESKKILEVLHHLLLDVIHDQIITLQYPGYEGYLLKYRDYLIFEKLRKQWGLKRRDRVHMLIQALRSTQPLRLYKRNVARAYYYILYQLSRFQTVHELRKLDSVQLAYQLYTILFDEKMFNLTRDLNYMSERLVLAVEGLPTPGEKGQEKGGKKNQSEHQADLTRDENWIHMPLSGSILKEMNLDLLNPWEQAEINVGEIQPIPSSEKMDSAEIIELLHQQGSSGTLFSKRGLKRLDIENMKQLKEEEYIPVEHTDLRYRYQIRRQIPQLTEDMKKDYARDRAAIQSQIIRLRNQWAWANTKQVLHQYGLKSGSLDEDALYQAKYSKELFMNPIIQNTRTKQLDIVLLIDASSSMYEQAEGIDLPKYRIARQLAALFVESLEVASSVQTWVYSFSQDSSKSILIQELYSPHRTARKERLAALAPGYRTPEYEALLAISKLVEEQGRVGVQKIILVLSDGQPGDDIIPYHVQKKRIKELVNKLEKQGDIIIQIPLGSETLSAEMYTHFVGLSDDGYHGIVLKFGKILKSLL